MIEILKLEDGRTLYIDGKGLNQVDVMEIVQKLANTFWAGHPRIKPKLLFEWQPKTFYDCPHEDTFEEAQEKIEHGF